MKFPAAIEKRSDPAVNWLRRVRDGEEKEFAFCEGVKLAEELVKSEVSIVGVFCSGAMEEFGRRFLERHRKPAPLSLLSEPVMTFVSDVKTPPGLIVIVKRPQPPREEALSGSGNPLFLVLHELQLPQNVGALFRTAEAAEVAEVILTKNTADPFSPKALRGSSGSVFRVPSKSQADFPTLLHEFFTKDIQTVAAMQDGEVRYDEWDWTRPTALVLGPEAAGFSPAQKKLFKTTVRIPMAGRVESLNVATAAAVCLFVAARQRHGWKAGGTHAAQR